jgi:sec-independent protein translocase protein TatC
MPGELRMSFFDHLEELRHRVMVSFAAFLIVFFIVYTMSIRRGELWGFTVYYPFPDFYNNIPAQLFRVFKADFLPDDIVLLNINGIDALLVDVKIAMFLSVAACTPVFAWQAGKFLLPALRKNERSFLAKIVVPTSVLFLVGALFSYFVFTPFAMSFFFTYSSNMTVGIPDGAGGYAPTIGVSNFLSWITIMVLAFGLIFELPVFMAGITFLSIVRARSWLAGWRYALIAFLVIGGIITPDVSGITQMVVAVPMFGLYMVGVGVAYYIERGRPKEDVEDLPEPGPDDDDL